MEPKASGLPSGWATVGPTPRGRLIELTFAVKQQNVGKLHDILMRVSTPASADYGMHLSNAEVHNLTAPQAAHIADVVSFVRSHGVAVRSDTSSSDFLSVVVPVELAEAMLSTKYSELVHEATGVKVQRTTLGYSLPPAVAAAVDFVFPSTHIPGIRRPIALRSSVNASDDDDTDSVPKNLRKLYSVGDAMGKAATNKQAVTGFLNNLYSESDLKDWWNKYCDGITCGKGLPKLVGDATDGGSGIESMLDIETITGMAGNIESEFWGFAGNSPDSPENEPYMKWLTQMSKTSDSDVPKLFSTSYGEDESAWPHAAAQRLNVEFMKAGARGISLLFASGDEGTNCKNGKFVAETPGSSPYVTTVGGTDSTDGFPSPGSETAVGLSSGGFSDYWPMPSWQMSAVTEYLGQADLPPKSNSYNVSGRAYPDIAALATSFCVSPIGCMVSGTSAASPVTAGIFSLLNDLRLQAGKSSLGFLNPLIYQNAAAFNDITSGNSNGGDCAGNGWPAKKGWDAVTGVGTPNYAKLAKVVAALPSGQLRSGVVV